VDELKQFESQCQQLMSKLQVCRSYIVSQIMLLDVMSDSVTVHLQHLKVSISEHMCILFL